MKATFNLDRRAPFQQVMANLKAEFINIVENDDYHTGKISISATRIFAAALQAADQIGPERLIDMIDYELLPTHRMSAEDSHKKANFKTVHTTLSMLDSIKAGAALMNIHGLGQKEDQARANEGHNDIYYRITSRQYLHLAVFALHMMDIENKVHCLISSAQYYPMRTPGPDKGTPKPPRIVVDNINPDIKKKSNGS